MITIVRSVVRAGAVLLPLVASVAIAQFFLPLRGIIESVDGQTLLVKALDGTMTNVKLADGAHVFTFNKASLVDVKRGRLVGLTAQRQMDSSQKVAEIYLFIDEATHEPWGLPASGSVLGKDEILDYIEGRVLTNDDRTLVIKSNDGEEKLTMPTNVRVVTLGPATVADIKAGQYVLVPNSKLVSVGTLASTIIVGSDSVDFAM